MKITQFILSKIERTGLNVETIAKQCEIGPATLYRYIRGERTIPPAVEKALGIVLKLDETEKQELQTILESFIPQRTMSKAFQMIDALVFGGDLPQEDVVMSDEVVLLDKDRYLMSVKDFLARILIHVDSPDFRCSLRFVQGVGSRYFKTLVNFVEELFRRTSNAAVEHLISISSKDQSNTVHALIEVLPLLKYENYSLFYNENESPDYPRKILGRSAYLSTSYNDENGQRQTENFLLSVRKGERAECLCFSDPLTHEFITNEYFNLRQQYKKSFTEFRTTHQDMDFFIRMERDRHVLRMKPDICYPRFSTEIYYKQVARISKEERAMFASGLTGQTVTSEAAEKIVDEFAAIVDIRFNVANTYPRTDICSKAGLLEMVKTRKLCDHFEWIPFYAKDELRMVLEYIRDRNISENNGYDLYITEKPILENSYVVFVYENEGILFQYNEEPVRTRINNNMYIQNKEIAELFCSYIRNYFPSNYAISKAKTTEYLNSLIDTYLS